jgi:hypothetical protein
VVVVAVVAAPDDLELEPPPLAAIATPVPPSASAVTAVASRAACFGRNTWDLLSVAGLGVLWIEQRPAKSSRRRG